MTANLSNLDAVPDDRDPSVRRGGDPSERRGGVPSERLGGDPSQRRGSDPSERRGGDPARRPGSNSGPALPPELDPRGRRSGRARAGATAANVSAPGPNAARFGASGPGRSDGGSASGNGGPGRSNTGSGSSNGGVGNSGGGNGGGGNGGTGPAGRGPGPRRRRPGGWLVGVRVLAAGLSLAVLVGGGWAWAVYRNFDAHLNRLNAIGGSTKLKKDIDGKAQNILLVGNDDRATATAAERKAIGISLDGGSTNTDTMMVMHVPANGKKATAISLPRDTWVSIPGHGMGRLNSAYADGKSDGKGSKAAGAQLLVRTIENLTGLTIDHYVSIDLLGFYRISNAIGGVQVCLLHAQNASTEGDASHPHGYSGINLKKGLNTIKGKQALAFVRQRHGLPRGDLDRIVRQQYFLSAVFRKVTTAGVLANPFKLQKLLTAVSSSMQLDGSTAGHTGLNPISLAQQLQNLSAGNLTFATIPTTGAVIDGADVQVVNPDTIPVFVGKVLGTTTTSAFTKAKTVAPSTVKVAVLNGTGTKGWASTNQAVLDRVGFKTTVGDAKASSTTQVLYPSGMEAQAKTVVAYVHGATASASSSVSVVTLVLGSDSKRASATATTVATPTKASATSKSSTKTGCIN
jgi:LCP family protein required for cell wall assembly